ncbi:MAG: type II toxin-antitoxin system VapC family toxin [Deltaproteobacteria bacterium]|nr:type II toxin-antitoxin system VapC family toxin [Deltaproteobacteria bacterium]
MNLDDIQSGSLCVIDTNVLLYAEQGLSAQAQRLLRRCSTGELIGVLPQTVWQELTHKLMLAEAIMLGRISGRYPAKQLAQKPDVVKRLSIYQEKIAALQDLGLGFEPCTRKDLLEDAFELQRKYGLLTNDSVVLATALRLGAEVLVSADAAFQQIPWPVVAWPSDLRV